MGVHEHAPQSEEVGAQAAFVVESVADWLAIGLDFGMANQQEQPAYKIRHIKGGVRLAALVGASEPFVRHLWRIEFSLHDALLSLYAQDFMALSIQLLVLQALDAYLLHRDAVARFLAAGGYSVIMRAMAAKRQVRQTFALACILRKLNLYECLQELRAHLEELRREGALAPPTLLVVAQALNQVLQYCRGGPFAMEQPRRFLPVSAQFELPRLATPPNMPVRYFEMAGLLEGLLLLLAGRSTLNLPAIKAPVLAVLATLLEDVEGVRFLSRRAPTANALLKCLLRPEDDELQYGETLEAQSHQLGLQLAYKLHALHLVDALRALSALDCDAGDVVDNLHQLFCLTFAPVGRQCVGEVVAMGDHALALLQFLKTAPGAESPGAAYIVDLLHVAVVLVGDVPFLERFSGRIREALALVAEPSGRVAEVRSYLLDGCPLSGCHVAALLGKVQEHLDGAVASPGPVVGALRALRHLGVAPQVGGAQDPLTQFVELKYKHVILELFSLDGSTVLTRLLQKLCAHFEQPGVHSSIFASTQGLLLANTIEPALALLQEMLAHVIQCRGTEFKDLTAVPVLLRTYTLLDSFPASCAATGAAQRCKMAVVDALLHYTQPVSDEESLSKTLWAQMVGEAFRYVTSAPCTFVAGLLVLSELLPLPLPLHASHALDPDMRPWLMNLRKLWAAHLLPHSALVQDMIGKLCISTQPQLLNLLRRICVQIADLAAGAALMVARGFLDLVLGALEPRPCSSHVARLLNFLACLVTHGAIKCAVLHLVGAEDKYAALLPAFAHVLQLPDRAPAHMQAQECVLSVLQSFCDVELTLLQSKGVARDVYLANALPGKEHLIGIVALLLDHLGADTSFVTCLPVVRILLLLTEHDYGFFHLRDALLRRDAPFAALLAQLVKATPAPDALSTLNILVEFLRLCAAVEEGDAHPRTIVLSGAELRHLVGWTEDTPHPLTLLEGMLQKQTEEEDAGLEAILEGLAQLLKQLRLGEEGALPPPGEVHLPGAEPLLAQYEGREVFSAADACDDRLTARYWLATPPEEGDADIETVACDLFEICRQLPPEYNLIKGVEKLCRISRTDPPPSDKAAKHAEEERNRARKPFITPMRPRGFPRTAPQRPDLFRSRPPNTSRPPSLHVDDFVALETCGAQPTGPTGYNKLSREILASSRMARGTRGRAFVPAERSVQYSRHMAWWAGPNRGAGTLHGPYF
ncbi:protein virilizer-like [Dendroctonus ponderosae]|nr:protein virilizer-like [Dendroctonus ponderosae]